MKTIVLVLSLMGSQASLIKVPASKLPFNPFIPRTAWVAERAVSATQKSILCGPKVKSKVFTSALMPAAFKGFQVVEQQIFVPKSVKANFLKSSAQDRKKGAPTNKVVAGMLPVPLQKTRRMVDDFLKNYGKNRETMRVAVPMMALLPPSGNIPMLEGQRPQVVTPLGEEVTSDVSSEGPESDAFSSQRELDNESEDDVFYDASEGDVFYDVEGGSAGQASNVRQQDGSPDREFGHTIAVRLTNGVGSQPLPEHPVVLDAVVQAVPAGDAATHIVPLRGQGHHQSWCSPSTSCLCIMQMILLWNVFGLWANNHPEYFNTGPACM